MIITSTSWYVCFPIAKVTRKKVILLTEYWYLSSDNLLIKLLIQITKFIARHSDEIIATSTKSYRAHLDFSIENTKIFKCIQCSIDYSNLPTKDLREELGLENKKVILFLSRIVPDKGLDYLINAFALLETKSNVALLIGGEGPSKKECEILVKKLNIKNIFFEGYIEDQASYFKTCDIFVLPAICEAHDLVIDGHNGYIVRNKNAQDLFEALYKITSYPELAGIMEQNSRKIFGNKNDIERMFEVFGKAIKRLQ
jgi:glycosyltransferase involved in cell wall biosynthesis